MRIVVMGSGGTGGYFGAKLARAGEDVTFVARGAHLSALRASGLRVKSAVEPMLTCAARLRSRSSSWRSPEPTSRTVLTMGPFHRTSLIE